MSDLLKEFIDSKIALQVNEDLSLVEKLQDLVEAETNVDEDALKGQTACAVEQTKRSLRKFGGRKPCIAFGKNTHIFTWCYGPWYEAEGLTIIRIEDFFSELDKQEHKEQESQEKWLALIL